VAYGDVTLRLDYAAQNPTWQQFDPYGNPRGSRGFLNDPDGSVTGLTDIGARWYDPVTGSFISLARCHGSLGCLGHVASSGLQELDHRYWRRASIDRVLESVR